MKNSVMLICLSGLLICLGVIFINHRVPADGLQPGLPGVSANSERQADGQNVSPPVSKPRFKLSANPHDGEAAADLLSQMGDLLAAGDPVDEEKLLALMAELVRRDPAAAAHFAQSLKAGTLREEVLRRVAQWWTAQDPMSATVWASQLPDEIERKSVLSDVCFQVAQTDAREAVQMAQEYGLSSLPGAVLPDLVQQWAAQDLSGAAAWIKQQPEGESRDQMYARLVLVQSAVAPAEAAELVIDQIPPGPIQTEAGISVVHQWGLRDMAGARAWVEEFPPGPLKERAENELSGIIAYQNPSP